MGIECIPTMLGMILVGINDKVIERENYMERTRANIERRDKMTREERFYEDRRQANRFMRP